MIILDTNVISALMLPAMNGVVVTWLDGQRQSEIWTSSISIYEILSGILALADGRRKSTMLADFDLLRATILRNRIVILDAKAAELAAGIGVQQFRSGHEVDLNDAYIAGIVLANDALLATRNTKHFKEISHRLINPWVA